MTKYPRVGFHCDSCGKDYAMERHNEHDGKDLCDNCYEDVEDDDDTDHMSRARGGMVRGGGSDQGRWQSNSLTRDIQAKTEHFNNEEKMARTIPIPEDEMTADALEMILKYNGHFQEKDD